MSSKVENEESDSNILKSYNQKALFINNIIILYNPYLYNN